MTNNNNIGTDHHQSRHTQQRKPREAEQVLQTCRHSPPTSKTVNENIYDKNFKGRTLEEGGKMEEEFEIFRREFMQDVVSSLNDDLGDGVATLTVDPDTGFYNIKFDGTISQSKLPVNGAHPTNSKLPSNNTSHCVQQTSQSTTSPTSLTVKYNIQHKKTVKGRTPKEGGRKILQHSLNIKKGLDDVAISINALHDRVEYVYSQVVDSFFKKYKPYVKGGALLHKKALFYRYHPKYTTAESIQHLKIIRGDALCLHERMEKLFERRLTHVRKFTTNLLKCLRLVKCRLLAHKERYKFQHYSYEWMNFDSAVTRIRSLIVPLLNQQVSTQWTWLATSFESLHSRLLKLVAEAHPMLGNSNQNNEKNPLLIVLTSFSPTMKQILSIQHLDFPLIPSRPFSLPSELCIPHQPNCTQTRDSTYLVYRIKWMLNSDGWMMLHDLKGWTPTKIMKRTPCWLY